MEGYGPALTAGADVTVAFVNLERNAKLRDRCQCVN